MTEPIAHNPAYRESGWDVTTDPLNPQPQIYPVCKDCGEAYDYVWAWFKPAPVPKGCRHKNGMVKNAEWDES